MCHFQGLSSPGNAGQKFKYFPGLVQPCLRKAGSCTQAAQNFKQRSALNMAGELAMDLQITQVVSWSCNTKLSLHGNLLDISSFVFNMFFFCPRKSAFTI